VIDPQETGNPRSPGPLSLLYVATVAAPIRNFLVPYARHFRALGWRVDAAASGGTMVPVLRDEFDHVYEIPLSRSILDAPSLVRGQRAILGILESRPDIVHVHTPIAAFLTRAAVRRLPARQRPAVVYTAHGFHFFRAGNIATNTLFRTAERLAGRWTDQLIVINDEDHDAAVRHRLVAAGRLVRVPGIGIDTAEYCRSSVASGDVAKARERLGLAFGVPLFVVVAELHPNKRHKDVIAALASMRFTEAHLAFLGEGRERSALEVLVDRYRLGRRVHFLGFVEDVRPVLASATALVLASTREGLARAIMEALALEVPVIASTARGNEELVGDDSGILVPTGDVRRMAAAMDWLAEHPDEARLMGARGRARMTERYELAAVIQLHERVYADVLRERARVI
jgi:glycosyltransferase involved in cell wall biosynthesis